MSSIRRQFQYIFGAEKIGFLRNIRNVYKEDDASDRLSILSTESRCFILGAADYGNLGDIAISYAQEHFLHSFFQDTFEVQTGHFWENYRALKRELRPSDLIMLQGGGNMGNLYEWFEIERCEIISLFPNNHIVIFPQTMDYRESGRGLLRYSAKTYAKHGKMLHLAARERHSYERMRAVYPKNDILCVPDIVLSLGTDPLFQGPITKPQNKLLLCIRSDAEQADLRLQLSQVLDYATQHNFDTERTDTVISTDFIPVSRRFQYLSDLIAQFRSARIIVTDRLHGMILAALAGVPCLALSNSNGKVEGVYQWIANDVSWVKFASQGSPVTPLLDQLVHMGGQQTTPFPADQVNLMFAPLVSTIKSLT